MPAIIQVTDLGDDTLANLAGDGQISLREALAIANTPGTTIDGVVSNDVADQIVFAVNGPILLSAAAGQFTITQTLTITGNGAANTLIDGQQLSRIFDITSTAEDVTLDGLTLKNGRTTTVGEDGGAIRFQSPGGSTLTIRNSTLSGNSTSGEAAEGGAIATFAAAVTVLNSTLAGNSSTGNYGGGGAIFSQSGTVTVSHSTLAGNFTSGLGSSSGSNSRGGAIISSSAQVTVSHSTLSGNSTVGIDADGGAIFSLSGGVTVTNSTLSGNSTAGTSATGGAIFARLGALTVTNSTVVQNQATHSFGGGIASNSGGVTLRNSIVAQNTDNGTAPDLRPGTGTLTVSNSLIGDNTGTGLVAANPDGNGNKIGMTGGLIDPLLGPLASNGGFTQTHALLTGSPAIDAGNNALALDIDGITALTADQRGNPFARVFNTTVDMGAYERQTVAGLSLIVDTAVDENDGIFTAGDLSLREAIDLANGSVGADVITFAAGINGLEIDLTLGQLTINETVTITGNGAANTVIDGQQLSRIFDITTTAGNVSLDGLTLKNGRTTAGNDRGGAIRFQSAAGSTLTIQHSTLSGNSTTGNNADGGAIRTYAGAVTVSNSTLSGNSTSGTSSEGGVIYADGGAVTVSNSTLSGNSTSGIGSEGGVIYADGGAVALTDSTFSNNSASGSGGAIYARSGGVTVTNSTLSGNSAVGAGKSGGAIYSLSGAVTVTNSTLSGNSTAGDAAEGGAIYTRQGAVTLTGSTLFGNSTAGTDAEGGAIYSSAGAVTVTNSTLSGNSTSGTGSDGGAIYVRSGAVTLTNSTLVQNQAANAPGGGIYSNFADVTIRNSIVAQNTDNGTAPDLRPSPSDPLTVSNSLIGNNLGTGLTAANPDGNGNKIGMPGALIDPLLGPLALNGGPTRTHALLVGSPALDAGNNALALAPDGITALTADQRGNPFARIFNTTVDMGAYERQTVAGLSLLVDTAVDENDGNFTAGDLSLREAIDLANGSVGADSITFAAALNGLEIDLSLGQMTINETVTITGNGATNTIIDGQQLSRLFDITSTAGDVTLDGLTLKNGRTTADQDNGGAIRFLSAAGSTLTIRNSTLSDHSTTGIFARGGAIYVDAGAVTVTNSTLSGNSTAGDSALGGAIYSKVGAGAVTVTNSTLSGNSTSGQSAHGGAIRSNTGAVTVTNSTLSGNSTSGSAARGGAIYSDEGTVTVTNSTLSGNFTTANNSGGGAIYANRSAVLLTGSTLSDNSTSGNGASGGAVFSFFGSGVTVTNSTLSGNSTAGTSSVGGTVYSYTGAVTLTNSTLVQNQATNAAGGGIFSRSAAVTLRNSIVAQNTDNGTAPDLRPSPSDPLTVSNSLVGNNLGTSLTAANPDGNGNKIGMPGAVIDPLLGPLAFNGGPTQTHALLVGSPALDAGNNALATDGMTALTSDQRGSPFLRIANTTVDMGAYEAQILNLVVDLAADENDGNFAAGDLSLREALALVNANPGAEVVTFAATLNGMEIDLSLGQLTISDSVTITGNGALNTIIDGQQLSRIFDITSTAGDVTLDGLTLKNGRTTGEGELGGAIRFQSAAGSALTIQNSTVVGNSTAGPNAFAGAIYAGEALTVTNSTLSGNSTAGLAGFGGAIFAAGDVTVTNSTISGNSTSGLFGYGAAISSTGDTVTVTSSTLSGNSTSGAFAYGGAIFADDAAITLTNSTLSGNSTSGSNGGAIYAREGPVTLTNSTVVRNQAANAAGGGIFSNSAPVTLGNSIVAQNSDNGTAPDLRPSPTDALTVSNSLIGNNLGTGLTAGNPAANGNKIGMPGAVIDPLLGPLGDNGGPTRTHALLAGSPARDGGDNALAVDALGAALATDQRGTGFPRVLGSSVDIGAFEATPERVRLGPDPSNPALMALFVTGDATNNTIRIRGTNRPGEVAVTLDGEDLGTFRPTGHLIVEGGAGADEITVTGTNLPSQLYGGPGNDSLTSGGGDDVLLGGDGDDILKGGNRRDLLIGGTGRDVLKGQMGQDILIAGSTLYDATTAAARQALDALMAVWAEGNSGSYEARIVQLRDTGVGTGNSIRLNATTVSDDEESDELRGSVNAGSQPPEVFNWFLANEDAQDRDTLVDRRQRETLTDIDPVI